MELDGCIYEEEDVDDDDGERERFSMEEATTLVECCDELCFKMRGERGGEGDDTKV